MKTFCFIPRPNLGEAIDRIVRYKKGSSRTKILNDLLLRGLKSFREEAKAQKTKAKATQKA